MVFPKSLSGSVVSACSDAVRFCLYLYGAISKINKLAGGGVFKLYRIFIAIDGAMILLSFSAKCAPVSTRKVLFFVICDTAMLAFLLWIKVNLKLGTVTQKVLFVGYAALCAVGTLIAVTLDFRPPKASRDPYLTEIIILDICLVLKFIICISIVERVCRKSQVRLDNF